MWSSGKALVNLFMNTILYHSYNTAVSNIPLLQKRKLRLRERSNLPKTKQLISAMGNIQTRFVCLQMPGCPSSWYVLTGASSAGLSWRWPLWHWQHKVSPWKPRGVHDTHLCNSEPLARAPTTLLNHIAHIAWNLHGLDSSSKQGWGPREIRKHDYMWEKQSSVKCLPNNPDLDYGPGQAAPKKSCLSQKWRMS